VSVDDDGRSLLLSGGENAIVVGIEEAHDLMESLSPMVIPEHFRMDGGVTVAKICGKLHFGVLCVIATNKASNKPDNDHVPEGGGSHRRRPLMGGYFLAMRVARCHKNHRGQNKNKSGDLPMPTILHARVLPVRHQRATRSDDAQYLRCIRGTKDSHLIMTEKLSLSAAFPMELIDAK
jgi:hypothetical protein